MLFLKHLCDISIMYVSQDCVFWVRICVFLSLCQFCEWNLSCFDRLLCDPESCMTESYSFLNTQLLHIVIDISYRQIRGKLISEHLQMRHLKRLDGVLNILSPHLFCIFCPRLFYFWRQPNYCMHFTLYILKHPYTIREADAPGCKVIRQLT